jgi:spore germination protein KA
LISYTARADFASESMIAHRVIILIDGIPLALVAPATFHFFIDYHDSLSENFFVILFDRFLFTIAFFISILLTPFVLAIINYYPELLPIDLIATTINSRKGISFSFTSETVIAEIMFQTFRIAGTRLPKGLDSSLLVVGSFLIGRVVIDAGILSQESLYIAAFSVITSYVISNNSSFNTSVNLFRWFLIACTIIFGFVGLSIGILLILIYVGSKESIFVPYLYPIAPFNAKELKKNLIPVNYLNKKNRKENKDEKIKNSISN